MKKYINILLALSILLLLCMFIKAYSNAHIDDADIRDLPSPKNNDVCEIVYNKCSNDISLPILLDSGKDDEIVKHTYYTLSYNEKHEQANWVQYLVTRQMINGSIDRDGQFVEDESVSTYSSKSADYKKSGYDRGHLCPAADMKLNAKCMQETFYMSNVSPQKHQFNAGIWLDLENYERDLVDEYDSLYIVAGPVLNDHLSYIYGKYNAISIPEYFYKVIYSPSHNFMQGYLIPHNVTYKTKKDISSYRVPVDSIESFTDIDFFGGVYNEEMLEKQY